MDIVSTIDNHEFQTINTNDFEQGQKGNLISSKPIKNKFFSITSTQQTTNVEIECGTLFNQLIHIIEDRYVMDYEDYAINFKKVVTTETLKAITTRYNVLKRDLFDFVDEKKFVVPKNRDIMTLFSNLCKCNFIVIPSSSNVFSTFNSSHYEKTTVISCTKKMMFSSFLSAQKHLQSQGFFEAKEFDKLKLSELIEYAKQNTIDLYGKKKKQEIYNIINSKINDKKIDIKL